MKLLLSCIGGISTTLLVEALEKEAVKRKLSCDIRAVAETMIEKEVGTFDVLLISTPVNKTNVEKILQGKYPFDIIHLAAYASLDAEHILDQAIDLYRKFYRKDVFSY